MTAREQRLSRRRRRKTVRLCGDVYERRRLYALHPGDVQSRRTARRKSRLRARCPPQRGQRNVPARHRTRVGPAGSERGRAVLRAHNCRRCAPHTRKTPEAKAVYITSPDYFGVISDVKSIAAVAREFGVPLLVDCAHGAHLKFLEKISRRLTSERQ